MPEFSSPDAHSNRISAYIAAATAHPRNGRRFVSVRASMAVSIAGKGARQARDDGKSAQLVCSLSHEVVSYARTDAGSGLRIGMKFFSRQVDFLL